jgi:glutamate synthase domain-containing protein 3
LRVAEGCIRARVCEKNNCPRGIATHEPKYKAKYVGRPQSIVRLLSYIADDVRQHLAQLGFSSLDDLVGHASVLQPNPDHALMMAHRGLSLERLTRRASHAVGDLQPVPSSLFARCTTDLNDRIAADVAAQLEAGGGQPLKYATRSVDRAVLARVSGAIAETRHRAHLARLAGDGDARAAIDRRSEDVRLRFEGSAGQGFAVFLIDGLDVHLCGEANDSVCKSMSGGRVVIVPHPEAPLDPERSAIIGNAALYGATGGSLFVRGFAGDRFAVRNSGATAVVQGVGLHACGYMTGGTVVVLGQMSHNVGAGMTGGVLYCRRENEDLLNHEYLTTHDLSASDEVTLRDLIASHAELTGSASAKRLLSQDGELGEAFIKCLPKHHAARRALPTVSSTPRMAPEAGQAMLSGV